MKPSIRRNSAERNLRDSKSKHKSLDLDLRKQLPIIEPSKEPIVLQIPTNPHFETPRLSPSTTPPPRTTRNDPKSPRKESRKTNSASPGARHKVLHSGSGETPTPILKPENAGSPRDDKKYLDLGTLEVALSELSIDFLTTKPMDETADQAKEVFWALNEGQSLLLLLPTGDQNAKDFCVALKNELNLQNFKSISRNFKSDPAVHQHEPQVPGQNIHFTKPTLMGNGGPADNSIVVKETRCFLTFSGVFGPIVVLTSKPTYVGAPVTAHLISSKGVNPYVVPAGSSKMTKVLDILLTLEFSANSPTEQVFKEVSTETVFPSLIATLQKSHERLFKFGVLSSSTRGPNITEEDLYQENDLNPDLQEFLDTIASKIPLEGSTCFAGGLYDAEYFYHTEFKQNQIAFHVGPLIVFNEDDPSRKRHIGNDVSVIIFQQAHQVIDISSFRSKFNHIFLIVSKVLIDTETFYSVNTVAKQVLYFPPYLSNHTNLIPKHRIRKFILTKLINGERYGLSRLPAFKAKELVRWNSLADLLTSNGIETEQSTVFSNRNN